MKHAITILELYAQHNELNAPLHDKDGESVQAANCREQADHCRKAIAVLEHACAPKETVAAGVGTITNESQARDEAARVTEARIEEVIVSEHYFTASEGVHGADHNPFETRKPSGHVLGDTPLSLLTFCVLTLANGFTVTGESACVSAGNFNADRGRKYARDSAINKVWLLEGYLLKQRLYEESMKESDLHGLTDSERDAVTDNGHDPMMIEVAAELCHEANRAYCKALGDDSQPHWGDAPDWQRASAIAGVEFHIANPDAGPSHSHDSWLRQKEADGWKHGPVKDAEKKEHPCFVPYDQLPPEQKAKDYIFGAIVKTIAGINKG